MTSKKHGSSSAALLFEEVRKILAMEEAMLQYASAVAPYYCMTSGEGHEVWDAHSAEPVFVVYQEGGR